jgi:hypothetical protein
MIYAVSSPLVRHWLLGAKQRRGLHFIKLSINFIDFNKIKVYIDFMKEPQPAWWGALDEEDLQFLKRFVLSSGSLKALCDEYGVSYPTLRVRLDRLITKVRTAEDPTLADSFQRKLYVLVADGKLSAALARDLWKAHRAVAAEETTTLV